MKELSKPINHEILLDDGYAKITEYLEGLGLPSDNIIAPINERKSIANLIPNYMNGLPDNLKRDGKYLSKFVVGAGFGLFDYALNAVWNEVVLALHEKAKLYGVDIFYDAAIGGRLRAEYKDEKDLPAVKDNTLVNTCKKLELISEPIYFKLKHILDMRNNVGISHPNDYQIKAFELMGWLQTCIEEVIADRPSPSAIQVKAFITNLRQRTTVLSAVEVETMIPHIGELSTVHCANITRTVFGIYVDPTADTITRKNISQISPHLWRLCTEETKYNFGFILEGYNNNLHQQKHELGVQFFDFCDAARYRTVNERSIMLNEICINLSTVHYARDNFYHEAPYAEKLSTYIQTESDIPNSIRSVLSKAILACRIGRGVEYCEGLSTSAKPHYDHVLSYCGDAMLPYLMAGLTDNQIQYKLSKTICKEHFVIIFTDLKTRVINQRIIEGIDYLLANLPSNPRAIFSTDFKRISETYISW